MMKNRADMFILSLGAGMITLSINSSLSLLDLKYWSLVAGIMIVSYWIRGGK